MSTDDIDSSLLDSRLSGGFFLMLLEFLPPLLEAFKGRLTYLHAMALGLPKGALWAMEKFVTANGKARSQWREFEVIRGRLIDG